ncbi:hypothetical protein EYF80_047986 [Liparis tanakae]|uniref:Uncharacterized protein n=1 Tax=Liparis tanakae TaxID=230148 RepID=A0A4Z2FLE5_9TELE|nr:hypothetical protein EYF80_047986 [Liparis tanakae]
MQADRRDVDAPFTCPYSIRYLTLTDLTLTDLTLTDLTLTDLTLTDLTLTDLSLRGRLHMEQRTLACRLGCCRPPVDVLWSRRHRRGDRIIDVLIQFIKTTAWKEFVLRGVSTNHVRAGFG